MTEEIGLPEPERLLLSTRREYLEAFERLLGLARRELRVFDTDLALLGVDAPQTNELLRAFLLRHRDNRLYIAVHDTTHIRGQCPRLLHLLRQTSDRLFINQTEGEAARAQDSFVLADRLHFLRRPVQAQPRAVLRLNDAQESQGIHLRFTEIWDSSVPAVSPSTSGL